MTRALLKFRERYKGYRVPIASLKTSQILIQLGIVDTATGMSSRRPKKAVEAVLEPHTDAAIQPLAEEEEELAEVVVDRPPAVSVLSKEQAVKLLKPVRGAKRGKSATTQGQPAASEAELAGMFVDLVDLLPPVPVKGEFDVNKIKSSLYFFS